MGASSPSIALDGYDASFKAETNGSYDVRQYMGVKKVTGDELHVTPLGSGDSSGTVIIGIAQADADDGESVRVRLSGISLVRAEGAVAQNDYCECIYDSGDEDKNGNMKAITVANSNKLTLGEMAACRALEDAADGEYFKAMIICEVAHVAWT